MDYDIDYEKMPKIDLNEIGTDKFKEMFSCEYRMPTITHYLNYNKQKIPIGESSLMINHKNQTIDWIKFFPFHNIISKQETIDGLFEEILYKLTLDNIEEIEQKSPIAKEYDIIDQTFDLKAEDKIVPIGFIRNYKRKGIGTLAHTQALERVSFVYGNNINEYKIMHNTANKERRKQLKAIGLKQNHLLSIDTIEMREPFHEYLEKSIAYLKSRGIY